MNKIEYISSGEIFVLSYIFFILIFSSLITKLNGFKTHIANFPFGKFSISSNIKPILLVIFLNSFYGSFSQATNIARHMVVGSFGKHTRKPKNSSFCNKTINLSIWYLTKNATKLQQTGGGQARQSAIQPRPSQVIQSILC